MAINAISREVSVVISVSCKRETGTCNLFRRISGDDKKIRKRGEKEEKYDLWRGETSRFVLALGLIIEGAKISLASGKRARYECISVEVFCSFSFNSDGK